MGQAANIWQAGSVVNVSGHEVRLAGMAMEVRLVGLVGGGVWWRQLNVVVWPAGPQGRYDDDSRVGQS